jgi:threonine/homoserine/homoserine lactone efflux protein
VAAAHLLAAMSPGPSFVLSARTASSEGVRPALALALGFGIGAAAWAAAALLGLALVFEAAPWVLVALKVVGGAYLVWIAWGLWRRAREPMPAPEPGAAPQGFGAALRRGLLVQLANPKVSIFFGAVFVGLVPEGAPLAAKALLLATVLVVETAWYVLVAWAFSTAPARAGYARWKTALDRAFGGALATFGALIATRQP